MLIALTLILTGCNSLPRDAADMADEQIESGQITLPTQQAPISLGFDGMLYQYVAIADNAGMGELGHYGACVGVACQWDPEVNSGRPFGTYTDSATGQVVLYTQFPVPVTGRGNSAIPGSKLVDWEGDDTNAEAEGVADGWSGLPMDDSVPYITIVTDCGEMHPNYFFGWDSDGNVALPEDPGSIGENACI